eukprot:gene7996-1223_t
MPAGAGARFKLQAHEALAARQQQESGGDSSGYKSKLEAADQACPNKEWIDFDKKVHFFRLHRYSSYYHLLWPRYSKKPIKTQSAAQSGSGPLSPREQSASGSLDQP